MSVTQVAARMLPCRERRARETKENGMNSTGGVLEPWLV